MGNAFVKLKLDDYQLVKFINGERDRAFISYMEHFQS